MIETEQANQSAAVLLVRTYILAGMWRCALASSPIPEFFVDSVVVLSNHERHSVTGRSRPSVLSVVH